MALHRSGDLAFFGDLAGLAQADTFAAWLAPLRKSEWVVYAKPPFGGPEAVLAYLSCHERALDRSERRCRITSHDVPAAKVIQHSL